MEIESDLKLLKYTDTEVLMDDFSMSMTDFMSRFEKFKVDEVSIEDAEDDICFNAKDVFDEFRVVSLIGLKYTEDEGTTEGKKGRNATRQICKCQRVFRNYLMASLKISFRFFSIKILGVIVFVISIAHVRQTELFEKRVRISAFKFEQIQHSSFLYQLEKF